MLNAEIIEAEAPPLVTQDGCFADVPPATVLPEVMIGLTGKRNVGKTTVADLLVREYGFCKVHAFESGKLAAAAWFDAIDCDGERMVFGDLKDVPSIDLPDGVAPRYFLEKFGKFMGVEMGIKWTLALELNLAARRWPGRPVVVESVVYEAPWFKAQGGRVWRLSRPGHVGPAGVESDAEQARITADAEIIAKSVSELESKARALVQQVVGGG